MPTPLLHFLRGNVGILYLYIFGWGRPLNFLPLKYNLPLWRAQEGSRQKA